MGVMSDMARLAEGATEVESAVGGGGCGVGALIDTLALTLDVFDELALAFVVPAADFVTVGFSFATFSFTGFLVAFFSGSGVGRVTPCGNSLPRDPPDPTTLSETLLGLGVVVVESVVGVGAPSEGASSEPLVLLSFKVNLGFLASAAAAAACSCSADDGACLPCDGVFNLIDTFLAGGAGGWDGTLDELANLSFNLVAPPSFFSAKAILFFLVGSKIPSLLPMEGLADVGGGRGATSSVVVFSRFFRSRCAIFSISFPNLEIHFVSLRLP